MPTETNTVRRGSVVIPLYHTPGTRGDGWTAVYREPDGKRRRVWRSTLTAAKREAEIVATRLANVPDTIVGPEAQDASRARQLAEAAGVGLLWAVQDYCELLKRLAGKATPQAAIDYFLSHATETLKQGNLSQIRDEFLKAQKQDGVSQLYLNELEGRLEQFCLDFSCPANSLTAEALDKWLRASQEKNGWSGRSRNHTRAAISNLLSFARRRNYLPRDWAEMKAVPRATEEDSDIKVYTPEDLSKILALKINPDLYPFIVLGAFTGARPSEIQRLHWEDFHWEAGELFIGKGKVRTAGNRTVPILPALAAWLQRCRKSSGLVTTLKNYSNPLVDLVRQAGVASIHDGLRHSYVSYRRAVTKDLAKVSGEVGTDMKTLTKRYCRPVKQADAEAWFALRP